MILKEFKFQVIIYFINGFKIFKIIFELICFEISFLINILLSTSKKNSQCIILVSHYILFITQSIIWVLKLIQPNSKFIIQINNQICQLILKPDMQTIIYNFSVFNELLDIFLLFKILACMKFIVILMISYNQLISNFNELFILYHFLFLS